MTDVSVVVDPEVRVATGRVVPASVPDVVPTDLRVVRFALVGGELCPVPSDAAVPQRWSGLREGIGTVGVFVTVITACLGFLALAPTALGYRPVAVTSASMAPALRTGDVVVTRPATGWLPVGAVIDFRSGDRRIMHRIVEVTAAGYRTRGDANRSPDGFEVVVDEVDGVGVMVVPLVGWPLVLVDDGRWVELVALAGALVGAGVASNRAWISAPLAAPTGG